MNNSKIMRIIGRVLAVGVIAGAGLVAAGPGANAADGGTWDALAQCESGGNWAINTGNGYYGGLQFSYSTWLGAGGGEFAQRADLASREQQITVANRLYATSGLSQWGCKA